MNSMNERRVLVEQMATKMNKNIFEGVADKLTEPRLQLQKQSEKLTSLEEAIKRCGLKDGMTISFHHHFRGGDKVVNLVVGKLAEMGFKNLHVAASSLQDVHEPLIEHIKNGGGDQDFNLRTARCTGNGNLTRTDGQSGGIPLAWRPWKCGGQRRPAH